MSVEWELVASKSPFGIDQAMQARKEKKETTIGGALAAEV